MTPHHNGQIPLKRSPKMIREMYQAAQPPVPMKTVRVVPTVRKPIKAVMRKYGPPIARKTDLAGMKGARRSVGGWAAGR